MPDVLDIFRPVPNEEPSPPPMKAFTVRIPAPLLGYVDEMAQTAGISRNAMAIHLLDWGVRHALERLPEELRSHILEAVSEDGFAAYVVPHATE